MLKVSEIRQVLLPGCRRAEGRTWKRRPSISLTGLAATLFAALSPALGHAQQNQVSPSTCYVPGSGTIYLIKAEGTPSTCRSGHVAVTLTAPGPAGPQLGPGNSLPTNSQGAYDFTNDNGFVGSTRARQLRDEFKFVHGKSKMRKCSANKSMTKFAVLKQL